MGQQASSLLDASSLAQPLLGREHERASTSIARSKSRSCLTLPTTQTIDEEAQEDFAILGMSVDSDEAVLETGMVCQHADDRSHPPKLLEYDAKSHLLKGLGPWRALCSGARAHTVLRFRELVRDVCTCALVSLVCAAMSPLLEENADAVLVSLWSVISGGLFFILGPYVGLMLARWWAMRNQCVGGLWGVQGQLAIYAAVWFNTDSAADKAARKLVIRYGALSHALLVCQAKGQDGPSKLQELVRAGLLTPEEVVALRPLPAKGQVVWAWMTRFWSCALATDDAARGGLRTSRVPHAAHVASEVLALCMQGRTSIGAAMTYITTQVPFSYVHLLALLVKFAQLVNAVYVGSHSGLVLSEPICQHDATLPKGYSPRYVLHPGCPPAISVYSYWSLAMIVLGWAVQGTRTPPPSLCLSAPHVRSVAVALIAVTLVVDAIHKPLPRTATICS